MDEEFYAAYESFRNQGLSHDEAFRRATLGPSSAPPAPTPPARAPSPPSPPRQQGGAGFFTGLGTGLRQGAGSFTGAIGTLTGGQGTSLGRGLQKAGESISGEDVELSGLARAGQVLGRTGFEIGSAITGGGAGLKVASKVPAVARALSGASRLGRAGATMAANAPIDIVQGLQYNEGMVLPGRGGSVAENVALSGAAGAILPAIRPRRTPTPPATAPSLPSAAVGAAEEAVEPVIRPRSMTRIPEEADAGLQRSIGMDREPVDVLDRVNIASGKRKLPQEDRLLSMWERPWTALINENKPILKVARSGGGDLEERVDGAIAVSAGWGQAAREYLNDNLQPIVRGVTEKLGPNGLDRVAKAAVVRRAYQSGLNIGMDAATLEEAYQTVMRDPNLVEATDGLQGFFRDLLRRRRDAGLITDEVFEAIEQSDDYYTPFMVDYYTMLKGSTSKSGGKWNVTDRGVKSIIRDPDFIRDYAITNPFEVAISQALMVQRDEGRMRLMSMMGELADTPLGKQFIEKVRYRQGIGTGLKGDTFQGIVDGTRVAYRISDPDLLQAIAGQNDLSRNIILKAMRAPAVVQRLGVIAPPDFALFSAIRDMFAYGIQRKDTARSAAETGIGSAIGAAIGAATADEDENIATRALSGAAFGAGVGMFARPATQIMSAVGDIVGDRDIYKRWLREGGSTEGFYVRGPDDATRILSLMNRDGVSMRDVVSPKNWRDAIMFIGSVAEQSPRLAKVKETLGSGIDTASRDQWAKAIQQGQDVSVRFARKGANKGVREIAAMTPFWNAGLQGWVKAFDLLKDRNAATKAFAGITAPTLALWAVNKDNDEYWQRPQWERDVFWLVPKEGGGFWRVPKPFQIGAVFATLPEKLATYASQQGLLGLESEAPVRDDTILGTLGSAARVAAVDPLVQSIPLPPVLSAPAQQYFNRDFFTGRDIVPQSYQNLPTEMQAMPRTSAIARAAGGEYVSPLRVDKVIGDLTGTAGRRVSESIIDPALRSQGMDAPVQRTSDEGVGQWALTALGGERFVTRDYDATESEYIARQRLDKLSKVNNGMNQLIRENASEEEVLAYIERNRDDIESYQALSGYRTALDRLTGTRRDLMRNREITPEERDQYLKEIKAAADEIAKEIIKYGVR